MALRFRRTISIIPGVRLNVSKTGVSVSAGVPGATVNVGKDGVTRTIGIPGTGLSDRAKVDVTTTDAPLALGPAIAAGVIGGLVALAISAAVWYFFLEL